MKNHTWIGVVASTTGLKGMCFQKLKITSAKVSLEAFLITLLFDAKEQDLHAKMEFC